MNESLILIAFGLLVGGAVFFLGWWLLSPTGGLHLGDAQRLRRRLASRSEDVLPEVPVNVLRDRSRQEASILEKIVGWLPGSQLLLLWLEIPGQRGSAYVYLLTALFLAGFGGIGVWKLMGDPAFALGGGLILGSLPFIKRSLDAAKRMDNFEEQLVSALDLMIRALQAGYLFSDTIRHVATEMDDPIATEFQILYDEMTAGVDLREAFRRMLKRVPSMGLMSIATTVALQRELGGSLAESFKKVGTLIRGRFELQRRIRTLTAEGRMTAWMMAALPVIMFLIMYFKAPHLMAGFLQDPIGVKALATAVGMIFIGIVWMRAMLRLDD